MANSSVETGIQEIDKDKDLQKIKLKKIEDHLKIGDRAINKLKIQNLDFILDLPLSVTVEIGKTHIPIKEILQLGQGSVVELDKTSDGPLEIFVNGKLVALGEVVVVNEKFGVKVTEILSPVDRIETLRELQKT